ncbi:MAG: response regulator [Anaerolinea sp.]|nr:response regulator [Anaerolinea sp.]
MKKIRLLIIEEHAAVRRALEIRLRSATRIELLTTTDDLSVGRQAVHQSQPDVVLLGCKGSRNEKLFSLIEAVREMVERQTAVIALASYADEVEREMLLQAGVSRYLLKDINSPQLINEIESIAQRQYNPRCFYPADYLFSPGSGYGQTKA